MGTGMSAVRPSAPNTQRVRLPSYESFHSLGRFSALDGLRAFAVTAVVWHHTAAGPGLNGLLAKGGYGVDLFFAISGFLITTLLLREHAQTGRIDIKAFYVRRSLRNFPLYYVVLALYAALIALTERGTARGLEFWDNLPYFASYTSNWFVRYNEVGTTFYFAWSLATEEQFYVVWAPAVWVALSYLRHGLAWSAGFMAAVTVIDLAVTAAGGRSLIATIITSVATPICVASLLAIAAHTRAGFRVCRWLSHPAAVVTLLLAALALLVGQTSRPALGTVFALLVVSLCLKDRSFLTPVLTLRPVMWFGMVSYGVYLLHMVAANAVERGLGVQHGPSQFLAAMALVTVMAWASWTLFESPILRLKRHWERVEKSPAPTA